jgi:hypothetical protein
MAVALARVVIGSKPMTDIVSTDGAILAARCPQGRRTSDRVFGCDRNAC